jgi:hypothetical protein
VEISYIPFSLSMGEERGRKGGRESPSRINDTKPHWSGDL